MSYEFTDEDAETMWIFGNKLVMFSLLAGITGLFGIVTSVLRLLDQASIRGFTLLITFLVILAAGPILYIPSDKFKEIALSEGKDIPALMEGLAKFGKGIAIIAALFLAIAVMQFVLILEKV